MPLSKCEGKDEQTFTKLNPNAQAFNPGHRHALNVFATPFMPSIRLKPSPDPVASTSLCPSALLPAPGVPFLRDLRLVPDSTATEVPPPVASITRQITTHGTSAAEPHKKRQHRLQTSERTVTPNNLLQHNAASPQQEPSLTRPQGFPNTLYLPVPQFPAAPEIQCFGYDGAAATTTPGVGPISFASIDPKMWCPPPCFPDPVKGRRVPPACSDGAKQQHVLPQKDDQAFSPGAPPIGQRSFFNLAHQGKMDSTASLASGTLFAQTHSAQALLLQQPFPTSSALVEAAQIQPTAFKADGRPPHSTRSHYSTRVECHKNPPVVRASCHYVDPTLGNGSTNAALTVPMGTLNHALESEINFASQHKTTDTSAPPSGVFDVAGAAKVPPYFVCPSIEPKHTNGEYLLASKETKTWALSPKNPIVVLIFGCRGSGKTTQSQIVAEKFNLLPLSSGDIFREGKNPFVELRRIVQEQFGSDGAMKYNGLVLDRFIVTSEVDAYYIQSTFCGTRLPTPLVFWLQLDPHTGMERARSRGEHKSTSVHWRHVERLAQEAAGEKVYRSCGRLTVVDCNGSSKEVVSQQITAAIESYINNPNKDTVMLPPYSLVETDVPLPLLGNYEDFEKFKKGVHAVIGNTEGRTDSVPLSAIGGYVDYKFFMEAYKNKCFVAHFMHVTLKVDGQRFLVARHRQRGFIGFPFLFNCCLDFNSLFAGADLPFCSRADGGDSFDALLDTELAVDCQGRAMLHIIDFVYLHGHQGKSLSFLERHQLLKMWIPKSYHYPGCLAGPRHFCLKQYAPINKLGTLLKHLKDAPFAIDGVIFQHNEVYRLGMDRFLFKWKPQELCTADFRLMKGQQSADDKYWEFQLYVIDSNSRGGASREEVPFLNAIGVFLPEEVAEHGLCKGKIVELRLYDAQSETGAPWALQKTDRSLWTLHRCRRDKPGPNKFSTVKQIAELSHLTYEELIEASNKVHYAPPMKKIFSDSNFKSGESDTRWNQIRR